MSDGVYSAPVHYDGVLAVEVIDPKWMTETLPKEEIEVPIAPSFVDETDGGMTAEQTEEAALLASLEAEGAAAVLNRTVVHVQPSNQNESTGEHGNQ